MNPTSPPAVSEPIVRVSCVRHTYPDRTIVHLCGLDFVVERGQRVVILGPNGCGKSTLLFHILGLLEPQEGAVSVFGVDPARQFSKIRERVGVVLQNVDEQILAPTVWDDVSFSPRNYGYTGAEVDTMVEAALERVGITHLRHKICHYLSGGEKRKVALAGALVLQPELLVLDEPFEGLDPASRADLVELLNQLHQEHGITFVTATHDINVVKAMADVVYVLVRGGEIVAHGSPDEVFRNPELLRASNLEPPVLAELFARLEAQGLSLGRPLSVDDAARALLDWSAKTRAQALRPPDRPARPEPPRPQPPPVLEPSPVRPVVHEPPASAAPTPVVRSRETQPTLPFEITEEP
jgi:cobalt/nickel transport system ATP-binding protein